ncbi:hypothetical protein AALB39_24595 [Lachnospiraceae bacterium 54-53]
MTLTEAQKRANKKYRKENVKRIPLDVQKDKYDNIKAAAEASNEKINSYIKKAIDMRMELEGFFKPEEQL